MFLVILLFSILHTRASSHSLDTNVITKLEYKDSTKLFNTKHAAETDAKDITKRRICRTINYTQSFSNNKIIHLITMVILKKGLINFCLKMIPYYHILQLRYDILKERYSHLIKKASFRDKLLKKAMRLFFNYFLIIVIGSLIEIHTGDTSITQRLLLTADLS